MTDAAKTQRELIANLVASAVTLASDPPVRNHNRRGIAQVWWDHIDQLRADLEALDVDWRAACERKHSR